ncbi:MAG TPA: DNA polymerase/3'-5' exonuclease PolX [Verrucomicrobiae bacterium]|nr:DNA polymerase/3'-5' exonuclease PolX [Verrucomicrobiae bacterium]
MQERFFIADQLREIGRLLEVKGENRFKAKAYERAARALETLSDDLDLLVLNRRLTEIPGVGAALAAVIDELYRTGRTSLLEELRAELPPGVVELKLVPGLSLKKIVALHAALGVAGIDDLKSAAEKGLIRTVKGFGAKGEAKILEAIAKLESGGDRLLLDHATDEAERLLRHVRSGSGVAKADIAGALRRRKESVARIPIVAAGPEPEKIVDHFLRYPALVHSERLDGCCRARLAPGAAVEIHTVPNADYAASLLRHTGSKRHYARLEELARAKKVDLSARAKSEEEIYRRLGMPFVPPELREDQGEIEAALAGNLPRLVEFEDIRGLTHCHTVYSDGKNSVEEMALAAEALGMKYLTITDHSPSAFYAGGVELDRLKRQWEEIDRAQEKVKLRLLKGTESDILPDGSLDYPADILERFDIVIASIHQRNKMDAEQMTRRIVTAMKSPFFKIWGHPLGRLLESRPPLECDMEKVLDTIAAANAAIEVNGDPRRLDLEPRWIRAARARGIKFLISTDAHSTRALGYLRYGVDMARRGWLTRDEVLNTLPEKDFVKAVHP